MEQMYSVTFIMDYFSIHTVINAEDEEQAERLAEDWLKENGLNISYWKVLDVEVQAD